MKRRFAVANGNARTLIPGHVHSTCLFCHRGLGANEMLEALPVGRRVAFDGATGRLWVVCRSCERWNLTPFEARWEAIEQAERHYRDTRTRVATDQIGLARLQDPHGAFDLIRVGRPLRPELAAWRYGDQFGRRRRTSLAIGGVAALGAAAFLASVPPLIPVLGVMGVLLPATIVNNAGGVRSLFVTTRVSDPAGGQVVVSTNERPLIRLVERSEAEGGWGLEVPYQRKIRPDEPWWAGAVNRPPEGTLHLSGADARRAAARLLPSVNGAGASARRVREAVALIERAGDAERWFSDAARRTREWAREQSWGDSGAVRFLPAPVRLALEMAAHEETERRALEGELALLEAAWREADEIAAIADSLALPRGLEARFEALRARVGRSSARSEG